MDKVNAKTRNTEADKLELNRLKTELETLDVTIEELEIQCMELQLKMNPEDDED